MDNQENNGTPTFDHREARLKSSLGLAFLGDAVYELLVRNEIFTNVDANPATLHNLTVRWVNAEAQNEQLQRVSEMLTEDELAIVKRGRNATKAPVPRRATPRDYRAATSLEALFGYLFMQKDYARIEQIFAVIAEDIRNNIEF